MTKVSTEKVVCPHGRTPKGGIPWRRSRTHVEQPGSKQAGPKVTGRSGYPECAGAWFAFAPPAPLGAWTEASLALLFNLERRRRGWRGRHLIPAPCTARRALPGCRFPSLSRAHGRRFFLGRLGPLVGAHSFLEFFCGYGRGDCAGAAFWFSTRSTNSFTVLLG